MNQKPEVKKAKSLPKTKTKSLNINHQIKETNILEVPKETKLKTNKTISTKEASAEILTIETKKELWFFRKFSKKTIVILLISYAIATLVAIFLLGYFLV